MKNTEAIKRAIIDGHRRGICDRDGNSVLDRDGHPVPKPSVRGVCKIYVVRNGKVVRK